METKTFNLEKIKEFTIPIEELQGKVNLLDEIYKKFVVHKNSIDVSSYNEDFLGQIQDLAGLLNQVKENLFQISIINHG